MGQGYGANVGVHGGSQSGDGVYGESNSGYGVHGKQGNYEGYLGFSDCAVQGRETASNNWGCLGMSGYAGYFAGRVLVRSLSTGSVCADSNGVLGNCVSDARLKRDVHNLAADIDVLDAVERLRGVTFAWDTSVDRAKDMGSRRELGLIAQEVEQVVPEVVGVGKDGYRSVDYSRLTALLIEVAKAQRAEIAAQRTVIDDLRARVDRLEARR
jgi:hypothetical protein